MFGLYIFSKNEYIPIFFYSLIAGLLIAMKAGPLLSVPVDVFQPVEEKMCPLLFGQREKPTEKQE